VRVDYQTFLRSKAVTAPLRGLDDAPPLASHLFRYQSDCTAFGLRAGSFGLFLDTGLGKTACELEWSQHAIEASNGIGLILTPLAVARQIETEGKRWGYDIRVIREQSDARPGLNVCNYDRLEKLDPSAFGSVVLDEASILKSFTGKTTRKLIDAFEGHRWRLAATATPAPNDHMELGQYSEFLGLMPSNEMLMRWFIADQTEMGRYRLKGHAVESFWDWMASWARMAEHPRDLGDDQEGFDLPPLRIERHTAKEEHDPSADASWGAIFDSAMISATTMHDVKRRTAGARADIAAGIAADCTEPVILWCDTNYEADAILKALRGRDDVREVRGSFSIDEKEDAVAAFLDGSARILLSKPSATGYGLNFQHCARMVFVGRSFSYEAYYQAVRRCWRFGQKRPVTVHLVVAAGEEHIGDVIDRKSDDHARMKRAMTSAMRRAMGQNARVKIAYEPTFEGRLPLWL